MDEVVPLTDVSMQKRREQLLARLEGRHLANRDKESTKLSRIVKDRQQEVDLLISRAVSELESGVTSDETMQELESAMQLFEPGRNIKRIQMVLDDLRRANISSKAKIAKSGGFSFAKKTNVIRPSPSTISPENGFLVTPASLNLREVVSDNSVVLSDKHNENIFLSGSNESSLKLKNLKNCVVKVTFRPSAVHMQGISDCKIVFLPVDTSILMFDIARTTVWAAAQQIRVHDSTEVDFHVSVRGALILEGCRAIRLAPYRVIFDQRCVSVDNDIQWRKPSDFDWLSEGQSPNWSIMDECEWISYDFSA